MLLLVIEQGGVPIEEDLTGEEAPLEEENLVENIEVPIEEEAGFTEEELIYY